MKYALYCEGNFVRIFPSETEAWSHVETMERLHGRSEEPLMNWTVKKLKNKEAGAG
jgi:hypothetical protein